MNTPNVLAHYGLRKAHPAAAELDHYEVRHGGLSICASKLAALKTAGGEIAIQKEGEKFDNALDALMGSTQKLKKLFKKHPAGPDDDRGRGEAAEELVDEVLAALQDFQRHPILMSIYTRSPMYRLGKTARKLHKRQEKVLQKYLDQGGGEEFFDDLPQRTQDELRRVKDTETLHMDVDRWLQDNAIDGHTSLSIWAADESWTGMVEVEARTDEDELDDDDADMLRDAPYGPYTVSARNKRDAEEAILDAFANDVPVSLPEDFDIEVERLKKKASTRTASGWIDDAVVSLAEEEGIDADDMKVRGKTPYGRGFNVESHGRGDSGESEWMVFKSSGDAEKAALEYVTEMLEEEPGNFTQSWLQHYVEIRDAGIIAQEDADSYWEDIDDERVLDEAGYETDYELLSGEYDEAEERLEEIPDDFEQVAIGSGEWNDLEKESQKLEALMKTIESDRDKLVAKARVEGAKSHAENLEDRIKSDPTGWLEEMGYDPDQYSNLSFVSIDVAKAAKAAIRDDGVAHFLDRYDGDETELDKGAVAYGTN